MAIMEGKPGSIEEVVKVVKNVVRRYCVKKSVGEARTGVLTARNN